MSTGTSAVAGAKTNGVVAHGVLFLRMVILLPYVLIRFRKHYLVRITIPQAETPVLLRLWAGTPSGRLVFLSRSVGCRSKLHWFCQPCNPTLLQRFRIYKAERLSR